MTLYPRGRGGSSLSEEDQLKLDGIETGAQVNPSVISDAEVVAGSSSATRSVSAVRLKKAALTWGRSASAVETASNITAASESVIAIAGCTQITLPAISGEVKNVVLRNLSGGAVNVLSGSGQTLDVFGTSVSIPDGGSAAFLSIAGTTRWSVLQPSDGLTLTDIEDGLSRFAMATRAPFTASSVATTAVTDVYTEQDIIANITIPAGELTAAMDRIDFRWIGQITITVNAGYAMTVKAYLGGNVAAQDDTATFTTSATARLLIFEGSIFRLTSTTGFVLCNYTLGAVHAATTGLGDFATAANAGRRPITSIAAGVAATWSGTVDFRLTGQFNNAGSGTISRVQAGWSMERIAR